MRVDVRTLVGFLKLIYAECLPGANVRSGAGEVKDPQDFGVRLLTGTAKNSAAVPN